MIAILAVVAAYLIGSVSFAVVASWAFGLPDPRTYGSGNPGATNVLRTGRKAAALVTFLGDAGKGAAAVLLARWAAPHLGLTGVTVAATAVAAFLGHLYPVYFGFKGGKGVATAFGLLLVLSLWVSLAAGAAFLGVVLITRYISLGSVLAAAVAAVAAPLLLGWTPGAIAIILMAVLIVVRHQPNLRRLLAGEESKVGARKTTPPPEQA
jgi:acyl phosphate:glycerol-3-phosphate acyltransferase